MIITLQRTFVKGEITEGQLRIDGLTLCDTLENTRSCLVSGDYRVHLHKCRQYARKMLLLAPDASCQSESAPSCPFAVCSSCESRTDVNLNTVMPRFCPMLKPGNGIHKRHDGSILVGRRQCMGLLVHPREVFDSLYARLRMALRRGNDVTLKIINA